MIKKILLNTVNKEARMDRVRRLLTSEGIMLKTYDLRCGVIETEHTHIRFISDTCSLLGFHDFDIAFGFEDKDNIEYSLKSFPDKYPGTAIGYIVKTEAEETLKEEQEKLKRQQKLFLNSTYGRFGTLLPDSDYSKEYVKYCESDVISTARLFNVRNEILNYKSVPNIRKYIKDVIFNDPATIIFWTDGTKTVVKADGEEFDPEKGMAMAIAKRVLGNKHDYYNTFKKYLKKYKPSTDGIDISFDGNTLAGAIDHLAKTAKKAGRKLMEV